MVGRRGLHASHVLHHHRGIWWCNRCGAYTSAGVKCSPKLLCKECRGYKTKAGRGYCRRLRRGLTPRAGLDWPMAAADPSFSAERATWDAIPRRRLRCKASLILQQLHLDPRLDAGLDDPEGSEHDEDCDLEPEDDLAGGLAGAAALREAPC